MYKSHIVLDVFIISRGHASELFEMAKEAFNDIPFLIEIFVDMPGLSRGPARWNNSRCSAVMHGINDQLPIIALISQNIARLEAFQQSHSLGYVAPLTGRRNQA